LLSTAEGKLAITGGMSNRVCVIDLPGLSHKLLESLPANSAIGKWAAARPTVPLTPTFPAVTCSVQASLTTGRPPGRHGIIANGQPTYLFPNDQNFVDPGNFTQYRRQISFWEQSNQFLETRRFWHEKYKTALLFFQNSMPGFSPPLRAAADFVLTPKPDHGPDGKLTNLCWSEPNEMAAEISRLLGPFPLMNYWGPMAGIASSQWIAKAAAWVWNNKAPQLQWTYIPHLDYDLQRFGPDSPQAVKAVVDAAAAIEPLVQAVLESGEKLMLLSEYAMRGVSVCFQPNRVLAEAGLLLTRETADGKLIDYERSGAIAMVDHQIAHVYCRDEASIEKTRAVFAPHRQARLVNSAQMGLTHRRSGDFVLMAEPAAWLDYRWWSNPADAPGFAKTVDIHRKPGYDPLELFWDRATNGVSQDVSLIRGSHGLVEDGEAVLICDPPAPQAAKAIDVAGLIERRLATEAELSAKTARHQGPRGDN
jgi:predicted AlkP superfamily pyrophosphatase or phosphodiesterase